MNARLIAVNLSLICRDPVCVPVPGSGKTGQVISSRQSGIRPLQIACLFFVEFLAIASLQAHEVVWWDSVLGPFGSPELLNFGLDDCGNPDYGTIGIVPSVGEPCTVVVNLNPTTSPAISTSFEGGANGGNAVWISVDVNPFAGPGPVTTTVSGEWHATGSPANEGCTATNPNPFSVPITISAPKPWTIWPGIMPATVRIDTGGVLWGLRAARSLNGPWYNVGLGTNFTVAADDNAQFFKSTHRFGGAFGGTILNPSGSPLSGINIGVQYGGMRTTTQADGSFEEYGLPRGTNIVAIEKPVTFVDATTGSNRTETVALNIEVPASNPTNAYYKMLQFQLAVLLVPVPACNCTPWCAIGVGTLDGVPTPVFYSGGAFPPKNGPANCGPVQVTVTPPNGAAYPITAGSTKHQNSGANPASGTWTVTTTVCGQSKQASITVP